MCRAIVHAEAASASIIYSFSSNSQQIKQKIEQQIKLQIKQQINKQPKSENGFETPASGERRCRSCWHT